MPEELEKLIEPFEDAVRKLGVETVREFLEGLFVVFEDS